MKTTKEKAEIMLAFDRGEKVECQYLGLRGMEWVLLAEDKEPEWNWPNNDYRIAEKPKAKIKMLCYLDEMYLIWVKEDKKSMPSWKRFPVGDKEGYVGNES